MRKAFLTAIATAALASALTVDAQAIPAVPKMLDHDAAANIIAARDRCGWHRHYSKHLHRCVWNWHR